MRGWMIVAACTLPFAALAQPDSSTAASAPAAAPSDATATAAPAAQPEATPVAAPAAPVASEGFASQTRLWLATQTSGTYAVSDERPMPGEVATLVYQRYLKSFTHPIPERYESDSFKASGAGASGGSSGP